MLNLFGDDENPIKSNRKQYDEYVFSYKKNHHIMIHNRDTEIIDYIICNKSNTIENFELLKQQQKSTIARSLGTDKHIDNFHCTNLYDDNLNITITNTSTIFNINLIINNLYINVFKKVKHNKNKLVHSILNNHIVFKNKATDEICRMCEFIYENKDFVENLSKIKFYIISKHLNYNIGPNYTNININVGELNKLKKIKELSNLNAIPEEYINILDHNPLKFYTNSIFSYSRLTHISVLDSKSGIACVINKENFDLVKNISTFDICKKVMSTKYCTRLNDKLLISKKDHDRLYNNNKFLNYYYGCSFTNLEFVTFDSKVKLSNEISINSKLIYFNPYKKIPNQTIVPKVQTKTLNSFINYKDNVCIVKKTKLDENYNSTVFDNQINEIKLMHQELIGLEENMKYINKHVNNNIDLITFSRYMISNSPYSIFSQVPTRSQFINRLILKKLNTGIDNIIFNIENKDKILNFFNPIINTENNYVLGLFTVNIFNKGICPNLFKMKNLGPVQKEISIVYLNKLNIVIKAGTSLAQMNMNDVFIGQLREMLILMNRKFTDLEFSKIEKDLKFLRLKSL